MSKLNKFGITEAQMLVLANQNALQYRFGQDDMRDLLAYSQALLALAAPVASAAPSGDLPPLPEPTIEGSVMHEELKICYRAPVHFTADQMQAYARAAIAHQPPKEDLTDEEINLIAIDFFGAITDRTQLKFARAIEAASAPNKQLVAALQALIEVAERCDSWESFPSDALDSARAALAAAGEVQS